jgi:hypothetical protein
MLGHDRDHDGGIFQALALVNGRRVGRHQGVEFAEARCGRYHTNVCGKSDLGTQRRVDRRRRDPGRQSSPRIVSFGESGRPVYKVARRACEPIACRLRRALSALVGPRTPLSFRVWLTEPQIAT